MDRWYINNCSINYNIKLLSAQSKSIKDRIVLRNLETPVSRNRSSAFFSSGGGEVSNVRNIAPIIKYEIYDMWGEVWDVPNFAPFVKFTTGANYRTSQKSQAKSHCYFSKQSLRLGEVWNGGRHINISQKSPPKNDIRQVTEYFLT